MRTELEQDKKIEVCKKDLIKILKGLKDIQINQFFEGDYFLRLENELDKLNFFIKIIK